MKESLPNCTTALYQTPRRHISTKLHGGTFLPNPTAAGEFFTPKFLRKEGNFTSSQLGTLHTFKSGAGGEAVTWPGKWWGYFYSWRKVYHPWAKSDPLTTAVSVLTGLGLFQHSPLASYGNGFLITFLHPSTLFPIDCPLGVLPHDGLLSSVTGSVLQWSTN